LQFQLSSRAMIALRLLACRYLSVKIEKMSRQDSDRQESGHSAIRRELRLSLSRGIAAE